MVPQRALHNVHDPEYQADLDIVSLLLQYERNKLHGRDPQHALEGERQEQQRHQLKKDVQHHAVEGLKKLALVHAVEDRVVFTIAEMVRPHQEQCCRSYVHRCRYMLELSLTREKPSGERTKHEGDDDLDVIEEKHKLGHVEHPANLSSVRQTDWHA
jgi:hypothetical protein